MRVQSKWSYRLMRIFGLSICEATFGCLAWWCCCIVMPVDGVHALGLTVSGNRTVPIEVYSYGTPEQQAHLAWWYYLWIVLGVGFGYSVFTAANGLLSNRRRREMGVSGQPCGVGA